MGTRAPYPWPSVCGGGTWSHHPPLESQITMIAALAQIEDACTCRIRPLSQLVPKETDIPAAGCISRPGPGCSRTKDGSCPAARSFENWERSRTWDEACVSVKN